MGRSIFPGGPEEYSTAPLGGDRHRGDVGRRYGRLADSLSNRLKCGFHHPVSLLLDPVRAGIDAGVLIVSAGNRGAGGIEDDCLCARGADVYSGQVKGLHSRSISPTARSVNGFCDIKQWHLVFDELIFI
jgi:hypothetical protein